jgi:sugar O-acyltransferase (sialic acid O-acetyltransferase NeuD family)
MSSLILLGGGGHARACIDVIELEGKFAIAGIIESHEDSDECKFKYPILGSDANLQTLLANIPFALIAVGQINSPEIRINLFNKLKFYNTNIPIIKSPLAYCSKNSDIGEGSILMHGSIVNSGAIIGENCIINSLSLIEHDVEIGAHCHISTGARINGGVTVGEGCFIGSGAIIKEGIHIGDRAIIGAGQVILKNISAGARIKVSDY